MDTSAHDLPALFSQLGLDNSDEGIERFLEQHKPIAPGAALVDLPFFSAAQRSFLQEALEQDSDWAEVVDTLDALLRQEADIRPS
ncbi:hypothetical protein GCM10011297_03800 [Bacterioplanes sanyensis]|jgi:hypothetical protein|uniref:DUF2789 domain-containing protein n=1 Tax=Bacterioplanes sanyensis TaxID=1249553 RepID=UPI0016787B08|nr:DUF2789 domain-containing protein [Bacterioplanes sanyensis]GGY34029.1 hypothetical protein GCM10011297_03800 [Bacterioplanes sanyensis]